MSYSLITFLPDSQRLKGGEQAVDILYGSKFKRCESNWLSHDRHRIKGVENMFMHSNLRNVLSHIVLLAAVVICSHSTAFAQPTRAPLFAVLLGGNETAGGDMDGNGSATVIIVGSTTLCFAVTVNGIVTPTAMHIHDGIAGVDGPVVVPLVPDPPSGNPGTSSGCIRGLSATLLNTIRNASSRFYINVHNAAFPAGALRGQLF